VTVEYLGSKDLAAKWERDNKMMTDILKTLGVAKQ
jgi:hypothetical protein